MKIPLTGKRGGFAIVDDDRTDLLQYKWQHTKGGYAVRHIYISNREDRKEYMHRYLCGSPEGMEIDHINGNKLDNRRENLRVCDRRTNATNSGKRYPRGKYGRNIAKMSGNRKKPYFVQCSYYGQPVYRGAYKTQAEAQMAAALLRKELGYVD